MTYAPRPRRRLPTKLLLVLAALVAVGVLVLYEAWRSGRCPTASEPYRPLSFEDVDPRAAVAVDLLVEPVGRGDLPCIRVRLGSETWLLPHPDPDTPLPQAHEIWNRLLPEYERIAASFAAAVREVCAADPERRCGVLRCLGAWEEVPEDVIAFVTDAFADAGVLDVVRAPPEGATVPADPRGDRTPGAGR